MATVQQYSVQLLGAARRVALKMGLEPTLAGKETRIMLRVLVGINAALIKTLVDKGVITDADLFAAIASTVGSPYPDEPVDPPGPPRVAGVTSVADLGLTATHVEGP